MSYKTRFAMFFGVVTIFNLAASFAHPVTPTLIQNLHLHDYMFGLALGVMMITNFLMSPFWGKINTYISSRTSLLICCFCYGIAQIWFSMATTELGIAMARMFAGLFTGGVYVSFMTYIVSAGAPEDRGKFLTYNATIKGVGGAFGYLIGGFLGEVSIKLAFYAQATVLILSAFLFFFICRPDAQAKVSDLSLKSLAKEANPFQAFIDSRKFMCVTFAMLFAINILINFSNTGFDQAFNYYLKDALSLTSSYNGIIKACVGLIAFTANMTLCLWIIRRMNLGRSLAAVIGGCAVMALGTVFSTDMVIFIVFSIIVYVGYIICDPLLQNMVSREASPEQRNLVMGFYNATQSLGSIVGSLTAGFVYAVYNRLPFILTCIVYGLSLLVAVAYLYRGKRKAHA